MSSEKRRTVSNIVLKIGDWNMTINGVTEQTTCSDVIKVFLCKSKMNYFKENAYSYAIFESGNSSERMLSDNTRVLKTVRSWGSDSSYYFSLKAAKRASKIYKARDIKAKRTYRVANNLNKCSKTEKAAKLANDMQSQRLLKITDNSDINDFVSFVSGKEIQIVDKINDIKYATKKVLKPKRVTVTQGHTNPIVAKKHTSVDCGVRNIPNHSTPTRCGPKPTSSRHQQLADDITANILQMNEREAKEVILRKYFEDYLCYNSPSGMPFPMPEREGGDGAESSFMVDKLDKGDASFSTASPLDVCGTRARRHSNSDSGQEDDDHLNNLDDAFICKSFRKRVDIETRFAHVRALPRQLVSYDVTMTSQVDKLVDYSVSSTENDISITDIFKRNVLDEDDEMASFMDSKLHDNFSDEGLSSLGSDDDNEVDV